MSGSPHADRSQQQIDLKASAPGFQARHKIAANVKAECGFSFDKTDLPNATAFALILDVAYLDVRQVMCIENTGANVNKFCITELMTQANLTVFDLAETDGMIEGLIFVAFNSDCNGCTKAAFNVAPSLIPGLNVTALVESKCDASFASTPIFYV
ncbi:hypothetical protein B0H19DRAFT_1253571 [Mycena capillaripes]|nr:hypothetical protein B0H19DRAFT_1253571 [Mycena capillaripes]